MERKFVGIYMLKSPSGKVYVGQSSDIINRVKTYKNCPDKAQIRLYNSLNKYGFENHDFKILEECEVEKLNEKERYWQDFYEVIGINGLNCKLTGIGDRKTVHSIETRKKISAALMGHKASKETIAKRIAKTTGQKRTQKTKDKISEALTGIKRSEETKQKIKENWAQDGYKERMKETWKRKIEEGFISANLGKFHSDESKEKMKNNHNSKGMSGKKHSEETKRKMALAFEKRKLENEKNKESQKS